MRGGNRSRRRATVDGSGGLVAFGGRALGIDCLLRFVVKARDALGLRGLGLDGLLGRGLVDKLGGRLGRRLALGVRSGDGLMRVLALGLGTHAQH